MTVLHRTHLTFPTTRARVETAERGLCDPRPTVYAAGTTAEAVLRKCSRVRR